MVMCRSCGEFVTARSEDGSLRPLADECPDCGGQKFKDVHTDETFEVDSP
jgi:predicted  nucleic acid-binding Zn-ribbon protein